MVAKHVSNLSRFLQEDLWKVKLTSLPKHKAFLYRQIRIWMITISEFGKDKCSEKASALTYLSLLSIVPVAAMAFGISTIFGLEDYLKDELSKYLAGQEEVLTWTLEFAGKMLETSNGGVISGISAAFLIYAVARLLNNIELAFNHIWDTKKARNIKRMITDYMSVILLGPIILILSSSASVYLATSLELITEKFAILGFLRPVILLIVQLVPYSLIWFLLFLIYIIFPNTSVKMRPAWIAGVVAGTAYQLTQVAWIEGQVFLSKYSVIYGSFAALPLFLIWLQLSWTIILFGAEFAFSIQNVDNWSYDNESLMMNHKTKRVLTLLVLSRIVKHFESKDAGMDFEMISADLNVPRRFVKEAISNLESTKLIVGANSSDDKEIYVPGIDLHKINLHMVLSRLDEIGMDNLPQIHENNGYDQLEILLNEIDRKIKESDLNKKLLDL